MLLALRISIQATEPKDQKHSSAQKVGFYHFQQKGRKVQKSIFCALFAAKKCFCTLFCALSEILAEAPLVVQIAVWVFRLCGSNWDTQLLEGNWLRVRRLFWSGPPMCPSGSKCGWDALLEAIWCRWYCLGALLVWGLGVSSLHWLKTPPKKNNFPANLTLRDFLDRGNSASIMWFWSRPNLKLPESLRHLGATKFALTRSVEKWFSCSAHILGLNLVHLRFSCTGSRVQTSQHNHGSLQHWRPFSCTSYKDEDWETYAAGIFPFLFFQGDHKWIDFFFRNTPHMCRANQRCILFLPLFATLALMAAWATAYYCQEVGPMFCTLPIVAHVCGDPLSRYTCRATHVATDFLRILGLFRCSSSIALHPTQKALSHLPPLTCQKCLHVKLPLKRCRKRSAPYLFKPEHISEWGGGGGQHIRGAIHPLPLPPSLFETALCAEMGCGGLLTRVFFVLEIRSSPFFAHQKKRIFVFFLWGDLVQNRPQNPAPAGCPCSTRKSRSEVPEREDLGKDNCLGKGGVDRAKKRKKGCTKKVGIHQYHSPRNFYKLIPSRFFLFVIFFCNFYGNSLRPPIFSVTPMRSSGSRVDWKIFFVIFTKLIPRKNFCLYCKNFDVDGMPRSWEDCRLVTAAHPTERMNACNTRPTCIDSSAGCSKDVLGREEYEEEDKNDNDKGPRRGARRQGERAREPLPEPEREHENQKGTRSKEEREGIEEGGVGGGEEEYGKD